MNVLYLKGGLPHLVQVDDAQLRRFNIHTRRDVELVQQRLHVFAHVASLREIGPTLGWVGLGCVGLEVGSGSRAMES